VVDIDIDSVSITLQDGTTEYGDVIVGADGVHASDASILAAYYTSLICLTVRDTDATHEREAFSLRIQCIPIRPKPKRGSCEITSAGRRDQERRPTLILVGQR